MSSTCLLILSTICHSLFIALRPRLTILSESWLQAEANEDALACRDPCLESTSADVTEAVEGGRAVPIQITRQQDAITGAHTLMISCALWVYNCTGLPIALQQLQQHEDADAENSYQVCGTVHPALPFFAWLCIACCKGSCCCSEACIQANNRKLVFFVTFT